MPADGPQPPVAGLDQAVRTLMLLLPRIVSRVKRSPMPPELASFRLAPRHLSLLAYLVMDGPLIVQELARRLDVAPTTVSLMVGELSRQGILERAELATDRRCVVVSIADEHRPAIDRWLSGGADAWRTALEPLTPSERRLFVDTLGVFEREFSGGLACAGESCDG